MFFVLHIEAKDLEMSNESRFLSVEAKELKKTGSFIGAKCSTVMAPFPSTREPTLHTLHKFLPSRLKKFSTAVHFSIKFLLFFPPPASTYFHSEIAS